MPLSVTQMLWVNLIMDTLAAGAGFAAARPQGLWTMRHAMLLAFIITPSMKRSIFVTGILSAAGLLGVLWWFYHTQGRRFASGTVHVFHAVRDDAGVEPPGKKAKLVVRLLTGMAEPGRSYWYFLPLLWRGRC